MSTPTVLTRNPLPDVAAVAMAAGRAEAHLLTVALAALAGMEGDLRTARELVLQDVRALEDTAREGLENTALLNEMADLADALRLPAEQAYGGGPTRAAILAKVLDWSDKRHTRSGQRPSSEGER